MSITSFSFLTMVLVGVLVYYIIPHKLQWIELLLLSLIFYYKTGTLYTLIYLIASVAIAYVVTILFGCMRSGGDKKRSQMPFVMMCVALALIIAIWFVVKGRDLWAFFLGKLMQYVSIPCGDMLLGLHLVSALGMGYYTLQILGYVIDCYWENITPQTNPFKLFLFTIYFPQLTTGPISRYSQLQTLYAPHKFEYHNITFGAQRILWGLVKKLVLAERISIIVTTITSALPDMYTGFFSWLAILLYPLQMYADFSGCMDIVLGVSEMFGIKLAENFNSPFFSRTSQEFWQRWHITLGAWAKDYVLYPLLKSNPMVKLGKYMRKKLGRQAGKFFINALGMFVLWTVMGIWHGGMRYIVGVSLWYWLILMAGDLLTPVFAKLTSACNMKTNSFSWHLFQSARTYLIYAVGATFFSVGISRGISLLKDALKVCLLPGYANPWIFFDESILKLGVTYGDINIIIIGVLLMLVTDILREKYGYARIWIEQQGFVLRWLIWMGLFVFVLIWGKYGPGYDAAEFIYKGF